jgi:hypothetical protein
MTTNALDLKTSMNREMIELMVREYGHSGSGLLWCTVRVTMRPMRLPTTRRQQMLSIHQQRSRNFNVAIGCFRAAFSENCDFAVDGLLSDMHLSDSASTSVDFLGGVVLSAPSSVVWQMFDTLSDESSSFESQSSKVSLPLSSISTDRYEFRDRDAIIGCKRQEPRS